MPRAPGVNRLLCGAAVIALLAVAGCGGGGGLGGSPDAAPPQPTIGSSDIGHLEVHTAQDDAYQMQQFPQAPAGNVFIALSGATFTMVRWHAPPGKLCGVSPGTPQVLRISLESGRRLQLPVASTMTGDCEYPRWSPDGTRIAALLPVDVIAIVDLQHRTVGPVQALANVTSLAWGPDGRIYATAALAGQWDIFAFDPTRGDPPQGLTFDEGVESSVDISPNGKYIAYVYQDTPGSTRWWLRVAPINNVAQGARDVMESLEPLTSVRWSPDGSELVLCKGDQLVICRVFARQLRHLVDFTSPSGHSCDWSADGDYILYTDGDDLYRVSAAQQSPTPLLLRADWGHSLDAWNSGRHIRRTLVGPTGSDFLGKDPPFGSEANALVIVHSDTGLVSAVAIKATGNVGLTDETPEHGASAVVCRATTSQRLVSIVEDNGPGHFAATWDLRIWGAVREVLIVFDASSGRVKSIMPLKAQTSSAAVRGLQVRIEGGRLVIGGTPMGLLGPDGKPVPGAGTVTEVAFDPQTGDILSWR